MSEITQVYQTTQIRELELLAQQRFGISDILLMQRAGKAAFDYLIQRWPAVTSITVLCGTGNNGGDGYVVAELAHLHGLKVQVCQIGDAQKIKDAAQIAYESCKTTGVTMHPFHHHAHLFSVDLIVDAIYGTGLRGEINKEAKIVIEAVNHAHVPIFAIDIPSGLDANTGSVSSVAIKATATMTFIGMKLGLLTGHGTSYTGELICDNLQLPEEMYTLVKPPLDQIQLKQFSHYLKPRKRDAHKGDSGHVLIVGGAAGFTGAPRMAAEAALRVGAGLVTVATHPKHAAILNLTVPEIMCQGVRTPNSLRKLMDKATVVVIGPGLGQSIWAKMLLKTVLESKLPLIVDADALNLIAAKPISHPNWILTPHPGEAGRLLDETAAEVQQDRLAALHKLEQIYGGIIVLKGAGSLVLAPHHHPAICYAGNPGMATAGMGDVLSGVIASLVAQGIPLIDAAKLGVCLHASAGDLAAKNGGERGMIATDLMIYLRKLANP